MILRDFETCNATSLWSHQTVFSWTTLKMGQMKENSTDKLHINLSVDILTVFAFLGDCVIESKQKNIFPHYYKTLCCVVKHQRDRVTFLSTVKSRPTSLRHVCLKIVVQTFEFSNWVYLNTADDITQVASCILFEESQRLAPQAYGYTNRLKKPFLFRIWDESRQTGLTLQAKCWQEAVKLTLFAVLCVLESTWNSQQFDTD